MTDANPVLLYLHDVTLRNAAQTLFPHISFEVRSGQHWAIAGDNEALKTALLEAIAGKAGILNGKIKYPFFDAYQAENKGADPLLHPQKRVHLVSFRHPFRTLSNTTDFYYQQRFNSIDAENSRTVAQYLTALQPVVPAPVWTFEKVVVALQLHPLLDEKLIKLSNGETKRVLLAAALLCNPVLLLLQHPFAGLDVAARRKISKLFQVIAQSGISLLMTVADSEIPDVITHVADITHEGQITCVVRKSYYPPVQSNTPISDIDRAEIKALQSLQAMPHYDTIIDMKSVTIRYGSAVILNNINWTVRQGERWALSGPNGSGKSTLLSLINGDNPQAFANQIILFDRKKGSGESIWDIKKKIGAFSPELYQYFPVETSCLQAVESGFYDTIGLFRPSYPHTADRARRWMRLLQVDHLAAKPLRQVLPVEQRLCLLARALVKSPVLLLLDEPCQGFNALEQARFKQVVETICACSKVTLIYVSHYAEEWPSCITKTLQLQNGKQVATLG